MSRPRQISRRPAATDLESGYPDVVHPVLRRVFAARGAVPDSLDLSLASIHPVSELGGTAAAAERLSQARERQEKVLVLGDFDVDGATATALMVTCLRAFGFSQVDFMVPDRQRFGYGLSPGIVAVAAARKPDLIITVDNGISSHAGIEAAAECGIDVIVTDHHLPGETLPAAVVIVNPNSPDNEFPSKALAGVGVAFYTMAALGQRLAADDLLSQADARSICADCLDLVALGTVADLVPLDYNNRILVAQGMARLRAGRTRPGILALFEAANRNYRDAVTSDLAFAIAPRLNAAGRLTDMTVGIHCLLEENVDKARKVARELSELNRQRRELQSEMQAEAEAQVERLQTADTDSLCLYDPGWHQGIVGLVATRVRERIHRPVIAFAPGEEAGLLKGSGRSVPGVHLRDMLAAVEARHPQLMDRYGGHAMAAGLTLSVDRLDQFRDAFAAEVERHAHEIAAVDELWSDGELAPDELGLELAEVLRHAAPWGQAFPEPAFDGLFEVADQRIVGETHLKLRLQPAGTRQTIDAIAFNLGDRYPLDEGRTVRALYRLDVNEFRSRRSPQLVVEYLEYE